MGQRERANTIGGAPQQEPELAAACSTAQQTTQHLLSLHPGAYLYHHRLPTLISKMWNDEDNNPYAAFDRRDSTNSDVAYPGSPGARL